LLRSSQAGETKVEHVATASGKMSLVPAAHEHALNQANGLNKVLLHPNIFIGMLE
jgi:hypothetical protein